MSKDNKKNVNSKSKYFKWGLTAFLVIMASVLSIYSILNLKIITGTISTFIKSIMPIVDGLVVAYVLSPLVDMIEDKAICPFLNKRKIEITPKRKGYIRLLTVLITLVIVIVLLSLFVRMVIPQLIENIQNIINQMPVYLDSLINIVNKLLEDLDIFKEKNIVSIIEHYYADIMNFVQTNIVPEINAWARSLSNSVFSFLGALWDLLIGFFIAVYLLISKEKFRAQFKKLIYAIFTRDRANLLISDIRYVDKTFTSFIGGKIVDSIIIGLLCFIILTLFNIPYALLVSVIIGVTNIIPFFGPFIGAIPSAVLILLINPVKALTFIIIILVLQQIDGNFIGPMILGNSTGLSGFWVIFSITLFGSIWGVPGMFLGVPTFACIYAWIKRRMTFSLDKKDLSLDTEDYYELNYINKDKKYINKEKSIVEVTNTKKYTSLNINEDIKQNSVKESVEKTKEFFSNIIHKDNTSNLAETTNESETPYNSVFDDDSHI